MAVKVQYIDLQDRFLSDLNAIVYLLKAVTVIHPKFDLHWVLDVSMQYAFIAILSEHFVYAYHNCSCSINQIKFFLHKICFNLFTGND